MIIYTTSHFHEDANKLAIKINCTLPRKQYGGIYPIPRGGIALGVRLAEQLSLPLLSLKDLHEVETPLIVDDLVDSGRTREKFKSYDFACIHIKKHTPTDKRPTYSLYTVDDWVEYWWETEDKQGSIEDSIARIFEFLNEDPTQVNLINAISKAIKTFAKEKKDGLQK